MKLGTQRFPSASVDRAAGKAPFPANGSDYANLPLVGTEGTFVLSLNWLYMPEYFAIE